MTLKNANYFKIYCRSHIYKYVKTENERTFIKLLTGVKLDRRGRLALDMVVKNDINCHISAFSQGHYNFTSLVELIIDFKYNFKFKTMS